nr:MAG TPA: hypothetical protein [Bacteriophage sp.]
MVTYYGIEVRVQLKFMIMQYIQLLITELGFQK